MYDNKKCNLLFKFCYSLLGNYKISQRLPAVVEPGTVQVLLAVIEPGIVQVLLAVMPAAAEQVYHNHHTGGGRLLTWYY